MISKRRFCEVEFANFDTKKYFTCVINNDQDNDDNDDVNIKTTMNYDVLIYWRAHRSGMCYFYINLRDRNELTHSLTHTHTRTDGESVCACVCVCLTESYDRYLITPCRIWLGSTFGLLETVLKNVYTSQWLLLFYRYFLVHTNIIKRVSIQNDRAAEAAGFSLTGVKHFLCYPVRSER